MVLDLLSGTPAPPAFRRPVFEVRFGDGGGASGGGGGVAAAVGSALGLGGGASDPWQQHLVAVSVESGIAPSVDAVEIWLTTDPQAPTVALDDEGSVSLGYADDSPVLTFTGKVASLRRGIGGLTRITATSGGAALARLRVNQSYEGQTAGDIVNDLTGRAEVAVGTVEDGIDLPFYVIDDRRSAWAHIAALARKSGYLALVTPEGELFFGPYEPGDPVQTFRYGEDILVLEAREGSPEVGAVTTWGEGAAGSQGKDAWSWLVKDPAAVQGSAGGDGPARWVHDPALRSGDAAQIAAEGIAAAAGRLQVTGTLVVPGAPTVTAGSTIEIDGAPQDALNGTFLVRWVRHRLAKREGFITRLAFGGSP
jgi:phage protein D